MGAPVNHKEKKSGSPSDNSPSSTGGLTVIIFLMLASVLVVGLILFKDKIFKKNSKQESKPDTFPESPKEETAPDTEPEVLEGEEEKEIQDAFDKIEAD